MGALYLIDNGFRIVKLALNMPKEEQRIRFLRRLDLPNDNWKFSAADVRERARWDDHQEAFSEKLSHTSTDWAPRHVIPAETKWFARVGAGAVLVRTLMEIDPHFPRVGEQQRQALREAGESLEAQARESAAPDPSEPQRREDQAGKLGRREGRQAEPTARQSRADKPVAARTR